MRRLGLIAFVLAAGCGGNDNNGPGDAAGVFPDNGFIGRSLQVEVDGDTTSWDSAATISFGDGVTVSGIEVVSPQVLRATLTIDPTAAAGKQDVTVTEANETFTLAQAFELKAPVTAEVAPNFEQGGFGLITLTNADLLHPFDLTTDANGNFVNLTVALADDNVSLNVVNATAETVTLSGTIDVNATTTGLITLTSTDTDGTTLLTTLFDAVPVAARTPIALTLGTPSNFTVAGNGNLFEITATDLALLHVDMTTDQNSTLPGFAVLPASGKWADTIIEHGNFNAPASAARDNRTVAAGDKFYLIATEFFGNPGYQATFNSKSIPLTGVTAVTDTGTNDTPNAAQALTGTLAEFDGTLSVGTDKDCFKITVANNKKLHVYTTDENGKSDTVVSIFDGILANSTDIADSDDADLGEDLVTAALTPAGAHAICIGASSPTSSPANAPYKAFVVIE
jgi:hypothetical protein